MKKGRKLVGRKDKRKEESGKEMRKKRRQAGGGGGWGVGWRRGFLTQELNTLPSGSEVNTPTT